MQIKLYEKLAGKKQYLRDLIQNDIELSLKERNVEEKWNGYTPKKVDNFSVVVSDGSFYIVQFLGFFLTVFGGYGYYYDLQDREKDEFFVGDVDLSVAKRPEYAKSYISFLMSLAEAKSIYKIALKKRPKLIMFDGTLTSRLITPFPKQSWFGKGEDLEEEMNMLVYEIFNEVKEQLVNFDDIYALSKQAKDIMIDRLPVENRRFDYLEALTSKLAYYEFMYILSEIFKIKDSIIIGVAKTSSGTDIFDCSIPDIKIYSKHAHDLGYSESIIQDVQRLKSSFGNIPQDISNYLGDLSIFSVYSKYADKKVINLIEFYQHPENETVKIEDVLDMLYSLSSNGYPFLLKKVDNEVRITKEDIEFIVRELGLENAITGREGL